MRSAAHGPRVNSSTVDWDPLYFFLIAVGYKVPWTAISSLLHQFNQQFRQPKVLLWLNLAYFLPSMPALLLHGSMQDWLEARLGVPRAAMARFTVGLGGLLLLCLAFPACSSSLPALLAITAAVGVAYSIAFGTSHQLVPRFSPRCTVALNTGFVSCGVVVLLADLALKPNSSNYTPAALNRLFEVAAAQTLVGLMSAALLLRRHWRRLQSTGKQQQVIGVLPPSGSGVFGRVGSGSSGSNGSSRQLLLPRPGWGVGHVAGGVGFRHGHHTAEHSSSSSSYSEQQQQQQQQHWNTSGHSAFPASNSGLSVHVTVSSDDGSEGPGSHQVSPQVPPSFRDHRWDPPKKHRGGSSSSSWGSRLMRRLQPVLLLLQLAWRIWPAWTALLLSVGSSMLVFPLFTCVDTSGSLGERLPQVMFYARLMGDILGRMVPPSWQLRSSKAVLAAAFLKTKLLLVLVPGILQPSLVGGDLALCVLVAANWFMSGYINTGAYLLAPRLATLEVQGPAAGGLGLWRLCGFGRRRARLAAGKVHSGGVGEGQGRPGGALGRVGAAALRSKAGAVMSFCFQASCFMGLLGAWVVQELLHSSGHPAFTTADQAAAVAAAAAMAAAAAGEGGRDGLGLGEALAPPGSTGVGFEGLASTAIGTAGGARFAATAGDAIGAAAAAIAASAAAVAGRGKPVA